MEEARTVKSLGEQIREAVDRVRQLTTRRPRAGIILGSGFSSLVQDVSSPQTIPFGDIPHFPMATVEGHPGKLVIGDIEGVDVAVMSGRVHFYEGYSMSRVVFPVRILQRLGCELLIVTNAAGGLSLFLQAGDLMLIEDHINMPGLAGLNPIADDYELALGPRFVSMTAAYDRELARIAIEAAGRMRLDLKKGVYAMVAGPSYETGAEIKYLRTIGADAVGMSTAPEVVVARQLGMRVLGLSGIANVATDDSQDPLSHEEVLACTARIAPKARGLLREFLREWIGRTQRTAPEDGR